MTQPADIQAPAPPDPSSISWALLEARRAAGDRETAPALNDPATPGDPSYAPIWSNDEWLAELANTAQLRGPLPGVPYYDPYAAALAFIHNPEVAIKRRTQGDETEEMADLKELAANLAQRSARLLATWPAVTPPPDADPASPATFWGTLTLNKTGW